MRDVMVSDEERKVYSQWTEVDGDLTACDPDTAHIILESRLMFCKNDRSRSKYWSIPDGVDCLNDLTYQEDGLRSHKLDLYLPHDAVLRNGKSLPVYIDIHGGGFMYGHKELNRNFCTHLAETGFAVFSINYTLMPQAGFMEQLREVELALAWIKTHLNQYPVSQDWVFITGDSAGATLGLYVLAIEGSEQFAHTLDIAQSQLHPMGAAFVSGLFNLNPYVSMRPGSFAPEGLETDGLKLLAPNFFRTFKENGGEQLANLSYITAEAQLPPIFLNTSSDDFLQAETLNLALALDKQGCEFELHDVHVGKTQVLGHVYPVAMTWLEESQQTLQEIQAFSYSLL